MKILIDGMFEVYRNHYAIKLNDSRGNSIGGVFGFLRSIIGYKNYFGVKPKVVWEGTELTRRNTLKQYKADREKDENVFSQVNKIKELMSLLNVTQYYAKKWEADDVLFSLAKVSNDIVFIITCDTDLYQAVDDKIFIYNPIQKKKIDKTEVFDKMKVFPEKVAFKKAISGDASDNIPGIKRLSSKLVCECVNKFKDINEMILYKDSIPYKIKEKILSGIDIIKRNYSIIKLENISEIIEIQKNDDDNALKHILEQLEFQIYLTQKYQELLDFKNYK